MPTICHVWRSSLLTRKRESSTASQQRRLVKVGFIFIFLQEKRKMERTLPSSPREATTRMATPLM